jgi:hypothetical protein
MHGAKGGFALEKGSPAEGAVYVGCFDEQKVTLFPFFEPKATSEVERFDHQKENQAPAKQVRILGEDDIRRDLGFASDTFTASDMTFEVISPFYPLPDPQVSSYDVNKRACCPALYLKLTVDNTAGISAKTGVVALHEHGCPLHISDPGGFRGFSLENAQMGLATTAAVQTVQILDFSEVMFTDFNPRIQGIGTCLGFLLEVPAGEKREMLISAAVYRRGPVTQGVEMPYWYTRFFANLNDVLRYSLSEADYYLGEAAARDAELAQAKLNAAQKFLIAQASHSYYGSTQWFDYAGAPFWNVNEGEYQMINTFDLTVDMLFYEMKFSPWTVKNVLNSFQTLYSYYDEVYFPGAPEKRFPGGISFTHDMGNRNLFSPKGYSSYEVSGLDRACFSYMTHEQLVNWVCCAGTYVTGTDDAGFLTENLKTFKDCYTSLLNRDNPDPAQRNGIMALESSRCGDGGEITTYDSLDSSLGQARNNLYLAVKTWAAYIGLSEIFERSGETDLAAQAYASARLCAETLVSAWRDDLGYIPAILEGDNASAIIPAIEGLVFPKVMGIAKAIDFDGDFAEFLATLKRHFLNILTPGVCLYDDNGWKLSSTADNSWMSKICLCQHVARTVLGIDFGDEQLKHDTAHMNWEIFGSTFNACSDQFTSGVAMGSLYYPRIVSNILWLAE